MLRQTRRVRRQRLCRVVVGALLTLVVFAGSAAAECAWVLWQKAIPVNASLTPIGDPFFYEPKAFATKTECDRELRFLAEADRYLMRSLVERGLPPPNPQLQFNCLPDTVDPREPKGGGR